MTTHERSLELAAAAIDFGLSDAERRELDAHLAACPGCRRSAALLRADATAIGAAPRPVLSAQRSEVILRRSLRRRPPTSQLRLLAVAAALAVIGGGALAVGTQLFRDDDPDGVAVVPSPTASAAPSASQDPSPVGEPTPVPSAAPTPAPTVAPSAAPPGSGALPIRADARAIGTEIAMAPAGGGALYVAVPDGRATVLTLLGPDGGPRGGWPVRIDAEFCRQILPGPDGIVAAVCAGPETEELFPSAHRVYGFDASGAPLPGWPVEIDCCAKARWVGDELTVVSSRYTTDVDDIGAPVGVHQVVVVAANGTVRAGAEVPLLGGHLDSYIGPDGTAWALRTGDIEASSTEVLAFNFGGRLDAWPIRFEGLLSPPAFDDESRAVLVAGSRGTGRSRVVVLDRDGGQVSESAELPTLPSPEWTGAGPDLLGTPAIAADGTAWVVGANAETDEARIWAISPAGEAIEGWPWTPPAELAHSGYCGGGDTGCGTTRVPLVAGRDDVLRVAYGSVGGSGAQGGAVTALTGNGQVVEGWPVTLNRQGAEYWALTGDDDGITYALAIEPESGSAFSATVLALEPDSTVRYGVTIVEP